MAQKQSKEYEIGFRIAADMESDFIKTFSSAAKSVEGVQDELKQLQKAKGPGDITKALRDGFDRTEGAAGDAYRAASRGPRDSTKDLRDGLKRTRESFEDTSHAANGFGDTIKRVAEYTGAYKLVSGVTESFTDVIGTVGDYQGAMKQIQAATGATAKEMGDMEQAAQDLYRQNIGEGYKEVAEAMAKAKQATRQQGTELEATTKNAIVYKDVFGEGIEASLKATDTMVKNFGISSAQAYNLLAQGAQGGLDKAGDLLDTANEYSVYFKTLGYSAEDMFSQLSSGLEAGAFNADKVGDAVKEFGIRIKDGSDSTSKAMAELFAPDDLNAFTTRLTKGTATAADRMRLLQHVSGDTANELVKGLQAGGKKAEDSITALQGALGGGNNILKGLSSGAIQGKEAMQQVIAKLSQIYDPIQRSTIGVALFGTQFEDMESTVIASLGTTRKQFDMTKDTMQQVADIKYDTTALSFQGLGRELMTEYVIPLGNELLPRLNELSGWLKENKGLLKNAAVVFAAAGTAKGIANVAGSIADMSAKAAAGGKSLGLLRGALGLTNPVGIAVTAIGALTFGVMEYRRHQEVARQSLLHMNEDLKKSAQQYQTISNQAAETKALAAEYDTLSQKISNNKDSSADLTAEKQRLEEVTKRLQELHPNTITQYDIENGKLKEKVGLAQKEADTERELAKLKLEREVADKSGDVPKLEKELQSLEKQTTSLKQQKDALDAAIPAFKQYEAQFQRILETDPSEERAQRLAGLLQQVNQTGDTVGLHFEHLGNLLGTSGDLSDKLVGVIDKIVTKSEELAAAKSSYEELYAAQKSLIELNLGASLEEQAKKFNALSDEEKSRFQAAVRSVNELNSEMDLLPTEKQIRVKLLFDEMNMPTLPAFKGIGSLQVVTNEEYAKSVQEQRNYPRFADGGVATRASIFGEAGPEMAIPLNNKPRSRELLERTNQIMGHSEGGTTTIQYSPSIVIQGNADQATVERIVEAGHDDFEKRMKTWLQQKARVSMA